VYSLLVPSSINGSDVIIKELNQAVYVFGINSIRICTGSFASRDLF
jgi:hypothetical protein